MTGPGPQAGAAQGAAPDDAVPDVAVPQGAAPTHPGWEEAVPGEAVPQHPAQEYAELVLDLVAQIPPGRASSYGAIADAARVLTGRGSARTVGQIMARYGHQVPWWRVVPATGVVPEHLRARAQVHLGEEGTALRASDPLRLDLRKAGWTPSI